MGSRQGKLQRSGQAGLVYITVKQSKHLQDRESERERDKKGESLEMLIQQKDSSIKIRNENISVNEANECETL